MTTGTWEPDDLSRKEIAKEYGYALKIIYSNKEIKKLFLEAVNDEGGVWTPKKFISSMMDTNWWKTNAGPAREAWAAQMMGTNPDGTYTADWEATLAKAGEAVDRAAGTMGAQLTPEQRDQMVQRYIYEGWADSSRQGQMMTAFSEYIGVEGEGGPAAGSLAGAAGSLQDVLKQAAIRNGLNLSDSYYTAAAKSVAAGLTTAEDWQRDVRQQAASLWPTWGDKIAAGADAKDLGSGYINMMAQTFEVDPNTISLDDPAIRAAMTRVDDKGNPMPVGLWDFQQGLRNDPRWMNTKQANDEISGIAHDVLRTFGFMGG